MEKVRAAPPPLLAAGWRALRRARAGRGFSMVEMVVVLVIVGIMIALALPRVQRQTNLARVNNAQSVVAGDLRRAATLAAQRRRPMEVRWDATSARLVVRQLGTTTELVHRALGARSEYRLQVSVAPDSAIILPSGLANAFCVRLQGGNAPDTVVRRVRITTSGQARLLAPGEACP